MKILQRLRTPLLVGLAVMLPGLLSASPIGTLDIAGLGVVRVSVSTIDFGPTGGGTGVFVVTATDGSFTTVPLGSDGTIVDLANPPVVPGPPLGSPVTPFFFTPATGTPLFAFNLEQVFLGGGTPCTVAPAVGHSCTPSEIVASSPFVLTQNTGSVSVGFSVRGTVFDLTDGTSAPYVGLFTANLTRAATDTVPEVLAALGPGGPGFIESSWSAEFTTVPEPASLTLIGAGIGLLALAGRLRHSRV